MFILRKQNGPPLDAFQQRAAGRVLGWVEVAQFSPDQRAVYCQLIWAEPPEWKLKALKVRGITERQNHAGENSKRK